MSISSLDTDLDLCDLEVASVMSSPESQHASPAPLQVDDGEFHPILIEQLDAPGRVHLPLFCFSEYLTCSGRCKGR